jgi:hypothetical protein
MKIIKYDIQFLVFHNFLLVNVFKIKYNKALLLFLFVCKYFYFIVFLLILNKINNKISY